MIKECSIRVLTVDNHPLFREGLSTVIQSQPDMILVGEAATGGEALQMFREHQPDITLIGLRLADSSGIEAMTAIRSQFPEARVILMFTCESDSEVQRGLKAGARGCLLKTTPPREMMERIRQVYAGKDGCGGQDRRAAAGAIV